METKADTKKSLRKEALRRRNALSLEKRLEKDAAIRNRLLRHPACIDALRVLLYASFRTEVDTAMLIKDMIRLGKQVFLPRVDEREKALSIHPVRSVDELSPGYCGIPEPSILESADVLDIDMLIVPGAAFDLAGRRIGYGGGYYDKLLASIKGIRPIMALAYEEQIFEGLPYEEHDIPVDFIITEKRAVACHG